MKLKNVEDVYALSSMQQLMLLHALSAPRQDVLFEQLSCRLEGPLDVVAMRRAWLTVFERHPVLRTAFVWEGLKKPLQVVRQKVELPWIEHDWRSVAEDEQATRWEELLAADREQGFDLSRAPLLRLLLARTGDETFRFAWSCHHLIADGWCLAIVLKEVFAFYEAFRQGQTMRLDRPRPFRDYIAWLGTQDASRAERFWRELLANYEPPGRLPVEHDNERAALDDLSYGQQRCVLSAATTDAMQTLARRHRVTQSTIVEAAWALLLQGYTGREDLVYGTTVSGRPASLTGIESIIGPFSNSVPMRVRLEAGADAASLLKRIQGRQVELREFEHSPLEEILGWSDLPQGRRLFESIVVFENFPLDEAYRERVGGLTVRDVQATAAANYPLTLVAVPGRRMSLSLRFDCRRFAAATAERMIGHLQTLLERIAENPSRRLAELEFVTPAEREQLSQWKHAPVEDGPQRRGRPASPYSQALFPEGSTRDDVEVIVLDDWGRLTPGDVPGNLYVGGPVASEGKLGEIDTEAGGRVPDPFSEEPNRQLIRTGERVRWQDDGLLEFLGSERDPLQIGIYRVDPREVEATLGAHALVEEALVTGWRDPLGEMRLAAYLVPGKGAKTLLDPTEHALLLGQLRTYLSERLPAALVPTAFVALDELPRTADGSVDVAALPEPTRPRPKSAGPLVVPRDPVEARLAAIWSEVLGMHPIGVTDNFMELGGHSTQAVSLIARIEEEFKRKLPLISLFQQPTVEHLAGMLRRPAAAGEATALVPIKMRGNKRPLFCVHPAGGTVFCYLELARHLEEDRPLFGLQAQGVEGEAAPHTTVEEMGEYYASAIRAEQQQGPYLICGWSSGGILAFEAARQLEEQGEEVALLALFDAGVRAAEETYTQSDFLPMLMMMFPGEERAEIEALEQQSPEEQLAYFQQRAELAQLVVAGAAASQAQHVFEVFQANVNAMTEYRPQPYGGKITLFRASEHTTPMHKDPYLGWGPWAAGGVEVHEIPGDHVTMFREPAIKRLAETLEECLKGAEGVENSLRLQ